MESKSGCTFYTDHNYKFCCIYYPKFNKFIESLRDTELARILNFINEDPNVTAIYKAKFSNAKYNIQIEYGWYKKHPDLLLDLVIDFPLGRIMIIIDNEYKMYEYLGVYSNNNVAEYEFSNTYKIIRFNFMDTCTKLERYLHNKKNLKKLIHLNNAAEFTDDLLERFADMVTENI